MLQPVVVRLRPGGGYELIAGERRWRAAREAGMATVPALVREAGDRDSLLLAVVENVVREQLSPVEEARAYAVLIDEFGLALADVAEQVGRSKPSISNRIRLLQLPDDVLELVERGELGERHARAVLSLPDHESRRLLARRIVREGMSAAAAERAAHAGGSRRRPRRKLPVDPALAARARAAAERVTGKAARLLAGRLELPFEDEHELAELAEALERAEAALGQPAESAGSRFATIRRAGD
jgi:ParB family transcriptional regulator, chromosome partitioning protein